MKKLLLFAITIFAYSDNFGQSNDFNKSPWNNINFPIVIDPYAGNGIDFDKLVTDARVAGIIHKASQGFKADNKYKSRSEVALTKNLLFASYHLGTNNEDPIKQADFYLKQIGANSKYPMALDIEDIGGNNISLQNAEKFITRIFKVTNKYPLIYVNDKVFKAICSKYDKKSVFAKCKLWYARFVITLPALSTKVWDKVSFWQFSCEINCTKTGQCLYNVPGTRYDIDVNVFNGNAEELKKYWNGFD